MTKRLFKFEGAHRTLWEIASMVGVARSTLFDRVTRQGLDIHEATTRPITPPHLKFKPKPPKVFEFRGQMMTLKEIAAVVDRHPNTVRRRIVNGHVLDGQELVDPYMEPHPLCRMIFYQGENLSVADWAKRTGIDRFTIYSRFYMGWDPIRAITTPIKATYQARTIRVRNRRTITRMVILTRNRRAIRRMVGAAYSSAVS
ncbi:hypothetical protein [Pararhodobacter aggregans]|uniref:Uncharacterized protein n=1 Tax=Pararhodobacter aggregans TaxID=404875 RepID=A0A2T7UWL2_9RHOB|nr:hypothetical protein [Pararhodobacter aggregans]PTX04607.1 hypothetical protein C8N33_10115 [Pararhodobacter aggregans]PVE48948.1 hypothetical protein DDE23_00640 [Pararhodobacter aggregans]